MKAKPSRDTRKPSVGPVTCDPEPVKYKVGDQPVPGEYLCVGCDSSMATIDEENDTLPPCRHCGTHYTVYRLDSEYRAAVAAAVAQHSA